MTEEAAETTTDATSSTDPDTDPNATSNTDPDTDPNVTSNTDSSTTPNATSSEGGKSSVYAAIAGNIGVAIVKFIASAVSGSSAMFSEAIHSLVDSGNGILILVGMKKAQRKPDFHHPFGSGKELYFYTLIVALAIFLLGGGVAIWEGVGAVRESLAGHNTIGDPLVSYIVLIACALIEGMSLRVAVKNFNAARGSMRTFEFIRYAKDPSIYTVVLEDTAAETGLLLAFIGTILTHATQNTIFDGAASILIGLLLCAVAIVLLKETRGLLVGEGVTEAEIDEMRAIVTEDDNVLECGKILTMYMGPASLVVAMDVTLAPDLEYYELDEVTDEIENRIAQRWPETAQVYVEIERLDGVVAQHNAQDRWGSKS